MAELARHLLPLLYFMAPAYLANMAPPFVRYWKGWNRPIHARTLGEHKTVVGYSLGVLIAIVTTAMQADIIHVMDAGRVVESGTHAELVALGGRYAASWRAQMREAGSAGVV